MRNSQLLSLWRVNVSKLKRRLKLQVPNLMALYSECSTYALSRPRNTAEATLLLSVLLSFLQKEDTRYGSRSDFCQKVVWKMQKKSFQIFLPPLPNYFFYFFFVIFCYFSSDYRLKGSFLKILVWWKWQFHALLDWILCLKISFSWSTNDDKIKFWIHWCNLGNWSGISIESQDSIDIG